MLFNSIQFAIFFAIVTLLYFLLPYRYRWVMLLGASCYFYMAFIPVYILILLFTILIDYCAGLLIERTHNGQRQFFLICSLLANVGVLAFFKYFNFLNTNIALFFRTLGLSYSIPDLTIVLPIGLSFHTFQSLSYTIEVYRGYQKAERNLGTFALYVMFYPQLVAGPIERPQNLLHQLKEKHDFDYQRVTDGLLVMAWGLFMKVVVADNLAPVVNIVYNDPTHYVGIPLIIATVLFAFQIYCDFAGYSYIAIGAARVMGITLMENFRQPYFSQSISEFWRRWHISLSTWFRDYLYIPLGGNRVAEWRWYFNLLIVFIVSGIWHGANWTFIIWGALHGLYLICSLVFTPGRTALIHWFRLNRHPMILQCVRRCTVFALVCFAWIFFRANNVGDAFYIATHLLGGPWVLSSIGLRKALPAFTGIALVGVVEILQQQRSAREMLRGQPFAVRWAAYYALVWAICIFGRIGKEQFIYFQF